MAHDHHGHGGMHDPVNATSSPMVTTPLQAILTAVLASTAATAPAHHMAPGTQSPPTDGHGHMNAHDSSMGGMHMDMGGMMMYFHFGLTETVLFKNWAVNSVGGMVGSVVGVFIMAAMYEGLKYFREHLFRLHFSSMHYSSVAVTGQDGRTLTEVHQIARNRIVSWAHFLQTFLHMVQVVLSYFLMLIFMTYNVWLCLGVVLGAGFGYFIFGWKKATVVDVTDHCH
ncbi:hypothetical protein HPB47_010790 [Ixodes persulcatus]|uniref:Uncharacterized protein n=1 Tax=Ixodes persulcatus TaxID=34615 RepID=A0AC60NY12_IXOPE|nr:hypothetical protein HPB47_010790 [Ixodes persulcatus]